MHFVCKNYHNDSNNKLRQNGAHVAAIAKCFNFQRACRQCRHHRHHFVFLSGLMATCRVVTLQPPQLGRPICKPLMYHSLRFFKTLFLYMFSCHDYVNSVLSINIKIQNDKWQKFYDKILQLGSADMPNISTNTPTFP